MTLALAAVDVPVFVAGAVGTGLFTHMLLDGIRAAWELLYDVGRNIL